MLNILVGLPHQSLQAISELACQSGAVQVAAGSGRQRAGQGTDQHAADDDVDELGVDAQGDPLPSEMEPSADLFSAGADAATASDDPLDFRDRVGGQRPGWQCGSERGLGELEAPSRP